jgi:hypothetical protein
VTGAPNADAPAGVRRRGSPCAELRDSCCRGFCTLLQYAASRVGVIYLLKS